MESLTEDLYNAAEKLIAEVEEMGKFRSLKPAQRGRMPYCHWLMVVFVVMVGVRRYGCCN